MDIFLSVNNREQNMQLPVVPSEFTISKPQGNDTFETATQGDLKLLGLPKLKGLVINSFFPVRDYPFLRTRERWGFDYVYMLDTWMLEKLPIRLVITETPINMAVAVDNFEYTIRQDGDLYYSLTLGEFPLVNVS